MHRDQLIGPADAAPPPAASARAPRRSSRARARRRAAPPVRNAASSADVGGRARDDGRDPEPELRAEPEPVHPSSELIEPALVDLPAGPGHASEQGRGRRRAAARRRAPRVARAPARRRAASERDRARRRRAARRRRRRRAVAPSRNAVTVTAHLDCRPRSPSGVMLASIDSPQGDHADATAPMIALAQPRTSSSVKRAAATPRLPAGVQARMIRPDPGRRRASRSTRRARPRAGVRELRFVLILDRVADERGRAPARWSRRPRRGRSPSTSTKYGAPGTP